MNSEELKTISNIASLNECAYIEYPNKGYVVIGVKKGKNVKVFAKNKDYYTAHYINKAYTNEAVTTIYPPIYELGELQLIIDNVKNDI